MQVEVELGASKARLETIQAEFTARVEAKIKLRYEPIQAQLKSDGEVMLAKLEAAKKMGYQDAEAEDKDEQNSFLNWASVCDC